MNLQPVKLVWWVLSHHLKNYSVFLSLTGSEHHSFIWSNKIHCLQHLWKSANVNVRENVKVQCKVLTSWKIKWEICEKDLFWFDFTEMDFVWPQTLGLGFISAVVKEAGQRWGKFESWKVQWATSGQGFHPPRTSEWAKVSHFNKSFNIKSVKILKSFDNFLTAR